MHSHVANNMVGKLHIHDVTACAARYLVCVSVCVCVSAALFSHLAQLRSKQEIRVTSASLGQQKIKSRFV